MTTTVHIALDILFGVGTALIVYYGRCFWAMRNQRKFERWLGDVEHAAHEVIRTDARAVAAKAELCELIGEIPTDFNPTVFLTCNIGEGLQKAVLYEAEHRGRVTPGTFERMFGLPLDMRAPAPRPQPSRVVEPTDPAPTIHATQLDEVWAVARGLRERDGTWIGTHRIPSP